MQPNRTTRRIVKAAVETLELRQMMAANPTPELVAITDGSNSFFNTRRAIAFYDVSSIKTGTSLFQQQPLFSIWQGFEITNAVAASDREKAETINNFAVSPDGKFGYEIGFDSGTPNTTNVAGDHNGDYDLYRLDIRAAYDDFITNNRPKGIMYAPRYSPDYIAGLATTTGIDANTFFSSKPTGPTGLVGVTETDIGVPVGRSNTNASGADDIIFLDGIVAKVGEIARRGAQQASTPFFDDQDLQVVSDDKVLLMETSLVDSTLGGSLSQDYSIRTIERVSTSPNAATYNAADDTGGFNGNSTQSWQSFGWTGDNYVDMDNNALSGGLSEVDGMRYVDQSGTKGVWVSERDGGGDQFSFFSLDFAGRVAKKLEMTKFAGGFDKDFKLAEDPTSNPSSADGDLYGFDVTDTGGLVIRESDFLGAGNAANQESKIITLDVNYAPADTNANGINELTLSNFATNGRLTPTITDDAGPVNAEYAVYDRAQNVIYYFPKDAANQDVYVYDLTTHQTFYQELDGTDHQFFSGNKIRAFTLTGTDTTAPTVAASYNYLNQTITLQFSESVAASLSTADFSLINDTTSTTIAASDLTLTSTGGNNYTVTYKTGAATAPLARGRYRFVIGAAGVTDAAGNPLAANSTTSFGVLPGDINNDGKVNFDDLIILAQNYNGTGRTFAQGNLNYNVGGNVNFDDLIVLAQNYNSTLPPAMVAARAPVVSKTGPASTLSASPTDGKKTTRIAEQVL